MGLLNYTTEIDADKTAQEISKCLSLHGASAVMTEYDEKEAVVSSISFKIKLDDQFITFRLPCDYKPVLEILKRDSKVEEYHALYEKTQTKLKLQAVRTAWRIVKDWVEAQCALIETQMVTTTQVFLPYAVAKDGRTLSEHINDNPSMLLGDGK